MIIIQNEATAHVAPIVSLSACIKFSHQTFYSERQGKKLLSLNTSKESVRNAEMKTDAWFKSNQVVVALGKLRIATM